MAPKQTLTILGIDPAMRNTGLALAEIDLFTLEWRVTDLRLLKTESEPANKQVRKSSLDLEAARTLHRGVKNYIENTGASIAFGEVPTGSQSSRACLGAGIAIGLLAGLPIPLVPVNPAEVQMAALGYKGKDKDAIIDWATQRFPDAPWLRRTLRGKPTLIKDNEHLADAVAALSAGIQTAEFQQTVAMMRAALPKAA